MINRQDLINAVRYQTNRLLDIDIVRASGQHTLRTHLQRIISDYAVNAIIDVGANEGGFGASVRSLGFTGNIYSFEPVAEAFGKLSLAATNDPQWTVFNFALGAEEAESIIHVSKFSQFSSILNANDYGNSWENMKVESHEKIRVRTLDNCFAEGLIPRQKRILLKMDTQGFDLQVFRGADLCLENVCCMLSELSLIPAYSGMPHYLEALSVYESKGLSVSGFYPITRNPALALNEVDCMLVNTRFFQGQ